MPPPPPPHTHLYDVAPEQCRRAKGVMNCASQTSELHPDSAASESFIFSQLPSFLSVCLASFSAVVQLLDVLCLCPESPLY